MQQILSVNVGQRRKQGSAQIERFHHAQPPLAQAASEGIPRDVLGHQHKAIVMSSDVQDVRQPAALQPLQVDRLILQPHQHPSGHSVARDGFHHHRPVIDDVRGHIGGDSLMLIQARPERVARSHDRLW